MRKSSLNKGKGYYFRIGPCLWLFMVFSLLGGCGSGPELYDKAMDWARTRAGLTQNSLTVMDHSIDYYEGGNPEGEAVILLHGFSGDKNHWLFLAPFLTGKYRVLIPDLPAHGQSSYKPEAVYSMKKQAGRVAAFARALGLERFHIAGNSMGGAIALQVAADCPDQVLSLGLMANGGIRSPEPSELTLLLEKGENPLIIRSWEEYKKMMDFAMEQKPYMPGAVAREAARRHMARTHIHEKVFQDLTENGRLEDMTPLLEKIQAPTLILWGDRDRLLHVSTVRVLEDALPQSETLVMEGVGHVPMMERPRETGLTYRDFISRHPEPTPKTL